MASFINDLRWSYEALKRNPGFVLTIVVTLGLGLSALLSVESAMKALWFKPLPYSNSENLVLFSRVSTDTSFSIPELSDLRRLTPSVAEIAEYHAMWFNAIDGGQPIRVKVGVVSPNFFDVLGIRPLLGRTFLPQDETPEGPPVLVLSHAFWHQRNGEIRGNIWKWSLQLNGLSHEVIGILPELPLYPDYYDIYVVTSACPFRSDPQISTAREARGFNAIGVRRNGATIDDLEKELLAASSKAMPGTEVLKVAADSLRESLSRRARPGLLALLFMTIMIFVAVCANVSNLFLARFVSRQKEVTIRLALGAGRWRIVRLILVESLMLSILASGLGLLVAIIQKDLISAVMRRFSPRVVEIAIDAESVAVALLMALVASAVTVLVAMIRLPAIESQNSGKPTGLHGWQERILVGVQVAISALLLTSAGLLGRSWHSLMKITPGFDSEHVLTARVDLDILRYQDSSQALSFQREVLASLRRMPEVAAAAYATSFPLSESGVPSLEVVTDSRARAGNATRMSFRSVSTSYFDVLKVPILLGRDFAEDDLYDHAKVVILNQTACRHLWPGKNPLAAQISLDHGRSWRTVVGVVRDVRQRTLSEAAVDEMYVPAEQQAFMNGYVLVRTVGEPTEFEPDLRRVVKAIDPLQPLAEVASLGSRRLESLASPRVLASFVAALAGLALIVSVGGLGSLVEFWSSLRTKEVGIRIALGASRQDVIISLLRGAMVIIAVALPLGLVAGIVINRALAKMLFDVAANDMATYVAAALVLLATALIGALPPAVRMAYLSDPISNLKGD